MDAKRKLIIETATAFFAEKGYHTTSVQEIAEKCSMSKASLYKLFTSKEDLFIAVFEYHQNIMFEKAATYSFDPSLTPKELLIKQLCTQIEDFIDRKDFIMMQIKEIPVTENNKLKDILIKVRSRIVLWQKNMLIHAYGDEIKPYIWDLTITLHGILKEYILHASEHKHVDHHAALDIATYIVDRLDIISKDLIKSKPKPLFKEEMLKSFPSHSDHIYNHLNKIAKYIQTLEDQTHREKLASSLEMLKKELTATQHRVFLIEALLQYFRKEEQLTMTIIELESLILGG
ncbi:AcrR family transcriptional regulator [Metabacillus crassostreae]|uniref:TetR/AcrR family transcriptional regulator n=1 Tax=Metabacillus crassostreae TaxID=929098 RepID=UPI001959870B|nr:TetR/AcrR family transcriptional regulator [Metabacillus crassostreae]MBM7604356.1 AcrR family transcriptional regulator [Metabacillus crassostreae]